MSGRRAIGRGVMERYQYMVHCVSCIARISIRARGEKEEIDDSRERKS